MLVIIQFVLYKQNQSFISRQARKEEMKTTHIIHSVVYEKSNFALLTTFIQLGIILHSL